MIHSNDCPRKLPKKLPTGATTIVNLPCNRWTCPTCFPRLLEDEISKLTAGIPVNCSGFAATVRSDASVMHTWNLLKNRMRRRYPDSYTYAARHVDPDGDEHLHAVVFHVNPTWLRSTWTDVGGSYFTLNSIHGIDALRGILNYMLRPRLTGTKIQTARSRQWPQGSTLPAEKSQPEDAESVTLTSKPTPMTAADKSPGPLTSPSNSPTQSAHDIPQESYSASLPVGSDDLPHNRESILQLTFNIAMTARTADIRLDAAKLYLAETRTKS